MKAIGVIPARFAATRFPGKPLTLILGKPLIEWVIARSKASKHLSEIWLATDHPQIAAVGQRLGVRTVMTPPDLPSGSDRVHWAASESDADVLVNIQGDEPLVTGQLLDHLVEPMLMDPNIEMATMARALHAGDLSSRSAVKVVLNRDSEAIYFSRFAIPYSRIDAPEQEAICLKHIGLYAFRKTFLTEFCSQPPTALELSEGLEQLRALYMKARIKVVQTDHDALGVDTPEDVAKVEAVLKLQGN